MGKVLLGQSSDFHGVCGTDVCLLYSWPATTVTCPVLVPDSIMGLVRACEAPLFLEGMRALNGSWGKWNDFLQHWTHWHTAQASLNNVTLLPTQATLNDANTPKDMEVEGRVVGKKEFNGSEGAWERATGVNMIKVYFICAWKFQRKNKKIFLKSQL